MNKVITIETDNIEAGDKVHWFKHTGYVTFVKDDSITIKWYTRHGEDIIPRKHFNPMKSFYIKGF